MARSYRPRRIPKYKGDRRDCLSCVAQRALAHVPGFALLCAPRATAESHVRAPFRSHPARLGCGRITRPYADSGLVAGAPGPRLPAAQRSLHAQREGGWRAGARGEQAHRRTERPWWQCPRVKGCRCAAAETCTLGAPGTTRASAAGTGSRRSGGRGA